MCLLLHTVEKFPGKLTVIAKIKMIGSMINWVNLNMKKSLLLAAAMVLSGCATIVNDPMIPMTFTFSDGSNGTCELQNKRGLWQTSLPATTMIRRSDDPLIYRCKTTDGREAVGSIVSEMEGEKLAASVFFFDFGITDAITDKHRKYQGNVVIPVRKAD